MEQERNDALNAVREQQEAETNFELGIIKKQVEDSIKDLKADSEVCLSNLVLFPALVIISKLLY